MVYLQVADARETARRLAEHGVLVHAPAPGTIRTVFHLDVSDVGVDRAVEAFREVLSAVGG